MRYSDTVLFIDARHIYRQLDRAHRDFTPEQIEFLANIASLYRGSQPSPPTPLPKGEGSTSANSSLLPLGEGGRRPGEGAWNIEEYFPDGKYRDIPGLCKVATIAEIEAQGWSLNPGRYVGVAEREADDFVFAERLEELNEELEVLNAEARELEERIGENVAMMLEQV